MDVARALALPHHAQHILRCQALLTTTASAVALVSSGFAAAAAAYGGMIAIVLTWWLARGLNTAFARETIVMQRAIYFGAMQRLAFAGTALALGIGVLRLAPLSLLAGFGICQVAYLTASAR